MRSLWFNALLTPAGALLVGSVLHRYGDRSVRNYRALGLLNAVRAYRERFGGSHPLDDDVALEVQTLLVDGTEFWSVGGKDPNLGVRELAPMETLGGQRSVPLSISLRSKSDIREVRDALSHASATPAVLGRALTALALAITVNSEEALAHWDDEWLDGVYLELFGRSWDAHHNGPEHQRHATGSAPAEQAQEEGAYEWPSEGG